MSNFRQAEAWAQRGVGPSISPDFESLPLKSSISRRLRRAKFGGNLLEKKDHPSVFPISPAEDSGSYVRGHHQLDARADYLAAGGKLDGIGRATGDYRLPALEVSQLSPDLQRFGVGPR